MPAKLDFIHPGEVLKEEFLEPLNVSMYKLAKDIDVPAIRVSQIVAGKRSITPDTALRLAKYFQVSPQFWLNLQSHYDLSLAQEGFEDNFAVNVKVFSLR